MRANYPACLTATIGFEGGFGPKGYVNHPEDPGGATQSGITRRVYDAYRRSLGKAVRPVNLIERAEIEAIYRQQYWDVIRGDDLPAGLDFVVFDYAVNSGVTRAADLLQSVIGCKVDGHIGLMTIAQARVTPVTAAIEEYCRRRESFLERLKTFRVFGKGWKARVEKGRVTALAMARGIT